MLAAFVVIAEARGADLFHLVEKIGGIDLQFHAFQRGQGLAKIVAQRCIDEGTGLVVENGCVLVVAEARSDITQARADAEAFERAALELVIGPQREGVIGRGIELLAHRFRRQFGDFNVIIGIGADEAPAIVQRGRGFEFHAARAQVELAQQVDAGRGLVDRRIVLIEIEEGGA